MGGVSLDDPIRSGHDDPFIKCLHFLCPRRRPLLKVLRVICVPSVFFIVIQLFGDFIILYEIDEIVRKSAMKMMRVSQYSWRITNSCS